MARPVRAWSIAVAAVLAVFVGRAVLEGRAAARRATELDRAGDVEGAIAQAMRATKWYVPFTTHPRDGYDLLRIIARRAETAGDVDTALVAWQAVRAGARGTRSFYTPYEDRLLEADERIAVLLASKPPPGIDKDKPREQVVKEHRALLARDDAPRASAVVALYLGAIAWFFGAFRIAAAISDRDGERTAIDGTWGGGRGRRALAGCAIALVGIVAFLAALARA